MKITLPELPYARNDLAPVISEQTIDFHYGKHHQAYANNLNNLLPGSEFETADLETIIRKADGGIFNNGAQVWNHSFYFLSFSPDPKDTPEGKLAELINRDFGSMENFKTSFQQTAATLFGSGWAWLVMDQQEKLKLVQTSNAGNPLRDGLKPLLTADVWEHAYYLDYQNRRPDHLAELWKIIDWSVIESRL